MTEKKRARVLQKGSRGKLHRKKRGASREGREELYKSAGKITAKRNVDGHRGERRNVFSGRRSSSSQSVSLNPTKVPGGDPEGERLKRPKSRSSGKRNWDNGGRLPLSFNLGEKKRSESSSVRPSDCGEKQELEVNGIPAQLN